jgi:hypothetical protein
MLAAVGRTGTQSLQRRFFVVKRGFSEKELAFFMNIDFTNHVALVALADEGGRKVIIGGGRYIVTEPSMAEIAFVVIDDYQGARALAPCKAPSRDHRPQSWAEEIGRRCPPGEHRHAEGLWQVRLPGPRQTGSAGGHLVLELQ